MLDIHRLSAAGGAEVAGVDLTALNAARFAELEHALYEHQVIVLRALAPSAHEFHAFARRFGTPEPHVIDQFHHPDIPDILILSNVKVDGTPIGLADSGTYFHTDYSYLEVPAKCTLLRSVTVPRTGGETLFANQRLAYEDLPQPLKRRVGPLTGRHHYGNRDDIGRESRTAASLLTGGQEAKMQWVEHPLVRPHPVTGRKALYAVSGSSFGIAGMDDAEARDLLGEIARHATRPQYCFAVKYGEGDVVVWDNASMLHAATLVDPDDARTLWRITVKEPRRGKIAGSAP